MCPKGLMQSKYKQPGSLSQGYLFHPSAQFKGTCGRNVYLYSACGPELGYSPCGTNTCRSLPGWSKYHFCRCFVPGTRPHLQECCIIEKNKKIRVKLNFNTNEVKFQKTRQNLKGGSNVLSCSGDAAVPKLTFSRSLKNNQICP